MSPLSQITCKTRKMQEDVNWLEELIFLFYTTDLRDGTDVDEDTEERLLTGVRRELNLIRSFLRRCTRIRGDHSDQVHAMAPPVQETVV